MVTVESALKLICEKIQEFPKEEKHISLTLGFYLFEDILATEDSPPFDTSAMDGFAVQSSDTQKTPKTLKIIEDIPAGMVPTKKISSGESSKIMTGAPLPKGADSVVKVEDTNGFGTEEVTIFRRAKIGEAIRKQGENIKKNDIALPKGAFIRAEEIAILASMGISHVPICKIPTIGILGTGDEIVDIDQPVQLGQIRNSNSYMLMALLKEMNLKGEFLGVAKDNKEHTKKMIQKGLQKDVLLLTGGASVGEKDYVKEILEDEGVTLHFQKVKIKPGKPTVFGTLDSKIIFALPGNPVSAMTSFFIFVRPALEKRLGNPNPLSTFPKVALSSDVPSYFRTRYLPAFWNKEADSNVEILPWKGSGDIFALSKMNCLAILPSEKSFQMGELVEILPR